MRKAVPILSEMEMCIDRRRIVIGAEAQVLVNPVRIDHLPGVHLPFGIPNLLELAEGFDQFSTEHLREKFGL